MADTQDIEIVRELIAGGVARGVREQPPRLTLRAASVVMDRSPACLSRWETGHRTPSDEDATRYAGIVFGDQLGPWVRALRRKSRRRR